jgi:hypothetical protein
MPWLYLRGLDCLRLYGGGLVLDIIVFLVEMTDVDVGPRTNTEVIVGEDAVIRRVD